MNGFSKQIVFKTKKSSQLAAFFDYKGKFILQQLLKYKLDRFA